MFIGFRERDAQQSCENLHNKQKDRTDVHTIPLALATLSTTAAAINSSCSPFSLIFGPPDWHYTPVPPICISGPALLGRQEYHKHPISPAPEQHNAMGQILRSNFSAAGIYNSIGRYVIPNLHRADSDRYLYIHFCDYAAIISPSIETRVTYGICRSNVAGTLGDG